MEGNLPIEAEIDGVFTKDQMIAYLEAMSHASSLKLNNMLISNWVQDLAPADYEFRKLVITNCNFRETEFATEVLAQHFHNLIEIKISQCFSSNGTDHSEYRDYIKNFGRRVISAFGGHCVAIQSFEIDDLCVVYPESFEYLLGLHGQSLTRLRFNSSRLNDNCFQMLGNCAGLRDLSMIYARNTTLPQLEAIGMLTNVERLTLTGMRNIRANELNQAFSLTVYPHLECLDVSACRHLDDRVVDTISRSYVNLRVMDISYCSKVTTAGVMKISRYCLHLVCFNLEGCTGITTNFLSQLVHQDRFMSLQLLSVRGTQVGGIDYYRHLIRIHRRQLRIIC